VNFFRLVVSFLFGFSLLPVFPEVDGVVARAIREFNFLERQHVRLVTSSGFPRQNSCKPHMIESGSKNIGGGVNEHELVSVGHLFAIPKAISFKPLRTHRCIGDQLARIPAEHPLRARIIVCGNLCPGTGGDEPQCR